MQQLLLLDDEQLHSLVVFVGESTLKTAMPDNVTYGMGYVRYIKSQTQVVLSEQQVQTIIEQIETGRYPRNFNTHRAHVKHVKTIKAKKDTQTTCPKCGSEMILRTAKKGKNTGKQFWGCSRFPNCRGVLKIAHNMQK